jgi:tripartite-type tricarboxylate transporter receptor subunit TctC
VIAKLNTAITGLLKQPDMQNSMRKVGTEIVYRTPDEFGKFLRVEQQKWSKLVKEIGVKVN